MGGNSEYFSNGLQIYKFFQIFVDYVPPLRVGECFKNACDQLHAEAWLATGCRPSKTFRGISMRKNLAAIAVFCFSSLLSCIMFAERAGVVPSSDGLPSGIAWYGVLTDGIAEAKATGKPIMLLSAAPQCAGVPGMW